MLCKDLQNDQISVVRKQMNGCINKNEGEVCVRETALLVGFIFSVECVFSWKLAAECK